MRIEVRRLGSGRTHIADVPMTSVVPGTVAGTPCEAVIGPVEAICGAFLRGYLIVMKPVTKMHEGDCRPCRHAVEREAS